MNKTIMKTYTIPVVWQMYGKIVVEADSVEEAIDSVENDATPLPDGSYIDGSFEVDHAAIDDE